jgi:hypothetical protein
MAIVTQLSVRISNEAGSVSEVTRTLGDAGIDIRGFSVSDSAEHGVLRLIVDRPDRALEVLNRAGMTPCETPVLVVALPDHPGGLAGVLKSVAEAGVRVEYFYSLLAPCVVLNVASAEAAEALLAGSPVRMIAADEIASLEAG